MVLPAERYATGIRRRRAGVLRRRIVRGILAVFLAWLLVSRFIAATYTVESVSMEPGLRPSDRVLASIVTYGAAVPFGTARIPGLYEPQRGDLVVVRPPFSAPQGVTERLLEPFVAFVTGQRASLGRDAWGGRRSAYMVKRLVGMPGDTLRLSGWLLQVRPRGAPAFVSELALVATPYRVVTSPAAPGWDASLPLSGSSRELVLGADEYWVLGDNRAASSDSRSWGAVGRGAIVAKVAWRYWPLRSIGVP